MTMFSEIELSEAELYLDWYYGRNAKQLKRGAKEIFYVENSFLGHTTPPHVTDFFYQIYDIAKEFYTNNHHEIMNGIIDYFYSCHNEDIEDVLQCSEDIPLYNLDIDSETDDRMVVIDSTSQELDNNTLLLLRTIFQNSLFRTLIEMLNTKEFNSFWNFEKKDVFRALSYTDDERENVEKNKFYLNKDKIISRYQTYVDETINILESIQQMMEEEEKEEEREKIRLKEERERKKLEEETRERRELKEEERKIMQERKEQQEKLAERQAELQRLKEEEEVRANVEIAKNERITQEKERQFELAKQHAEVVEKVRNQKKQDWKEQKESEVALAKELIQSITTPQNEAPQKQKRVYKKKAIKTDTLKAIANTGKKKKDDK
jgi:hypothetical protein